MPSTDASLSVFLVEDNDVDAELITRALAGQYRIVRASTLQEAKRRLRDEELDLALVDYTLPDGDGLELLDQIRTTEPELPVVFVTAANDAKTGIAAVRGGAAEFIVKDADYLGSLPVIVEKALRAARERSRAAHLHSELRRHKRELDILRRQVSTSDGTALIGNSETMRELDRQIELAARTDETILLTGETGVGKEVVARAIHARSARASGPFVAVNCAALPESMVEAELFGHKRGSFTGADRDRAGYFHAAGSGTLFLDEVGEVPASTQVRLLRVLQEAAFTPIGALQPERFRGRILAATNKDLVAAVAHGEFRDDLYYRLRVVPIHVSALRDRCQDIPDLVRCFLERYNSRYKTRFEKLSDATVKLLQKSSWPGNVRELENFVYRLLAMSEKNDGEVSISDVARDELARNDGHETAPLLAALERNRWNRQKAADELGISRTTLWRKLQRHGLAPK